jgi:hypothetical protein
MAQTRMKPPPLAPATSPNLAAELKRFFLLTPSQIVGLVHAYEVHTGQPITPDPVAFDRLNRVVGWRQESVDQSTYRFSLTTMMEFVVKVPTRGTPWIDPRTWAVYDRLRCGALDRTPGLWPALASLLRVQPRLLDQPLHLALVTHALTFYTLALSELVDPVPWLTARVTPDMDLPGLLTVLGYPQALVLALQPALMPVLAGSRALVRTPAVPPTPHPLA